MTKLQQRVKSWETKLGVNLPDKPSVPDRLTRILRVSLLLEELLELAEASGVGIQCGDKYLNMDDFTFDVHPTEADLVGVADALGDIDFVLKGTYLSYGLDDEPITEEICRSNDSKLEDGYFREDGKWVKGAAYSPPDLGKIISAKEVA